MILDEHSSHVTAKFILEAYKARVQLLYLPPHTSHKTQPLDRSMFSPLKHFFREEVQRLAPFSGNAPIYKHRFLKYYKKASGLGMTSHNLRSGFRKTGIWPLDPSQILDDLKAILDPDILPAQPSPPTSDLPVTIRDPFATPQKSYNIRQAQRFAQEVGGSDERVIRTLFNKVGRSLDRKNAEIVALRAQVSHLTTELEASKPHTRKKVKESANDQFTRIQDIVEAQEASERPLKRRRAAQLPTQAPAIEDAQEVIVCGLQALCEVEEMQ